MSKWREWYRKNPEASKLIGLALLLAVSFWAGRVAAYAVDSFMTDREPRGVYGSAMRGTGQSAGEGMMMTQAKNWGLGFGAEGTQPTGTASAKELAAYNAYYIGDVSQKKLYLTFDCGYENGNTEPILEALQKHKAQATFFVVGHFLETAPELVKRMVEEGHMVGNHTYHHPDMSAISDQSKFREEMDSVAALYEEITGEKMAAIYRPPQGKYSLNNLQMAKELGYHTFFWSLAYVDWNTDAQPTHEEAFGKLCSRVHPGAIVLLHNTSRTNGEILDELLSRWEEMGYTFGSLEEFCGDYGK